MASPVRTSRRAMDCAASSAWARAFISPRSRTDFRAEAAAKAKLMRKPRHRMPDSPSRTIAACIIVKTSSVSPISQTQAAIPSRQASS